jgi:hypothetical protein
MYKKLKRGGLTPGLKNYVKKDNSEEALIKAFKKNSNLAIFVKKSEIMKNPGDYTPVEGNLEKMLKPKNKKTGGISKIDKLRSTKGQFTIEGRIQTLKEKLKKTFGKKSGGLTGGQKKLDKNKDGKITGEDFKMMKQGYGAARKDGMGLQDEKVKPGKVMKAGMGAIMLAKKMGGGMMQRPMGYKHGTKPGAGPLGAAGLRQPAKENIDQIIKDQKFPPISIYIEDKKKQKPFPVPSLYNNNKKPSAGRIRKVEPRPKKMGEPKRYKSGTMVKASEGIMALKKTKGGGADMGTEMSDKRKKKFKEILARLKNPTTINIKSDYKPDTKSPMQRDRKREGYRAKVESKGGKVLFMDEMKKGGSVMARGCKLGRKKATKLY